MGEPIVIAHRGYSAKHPENTAEGFEAAITANADFIETDVRLTSDGVLVCSHDPSFERLTGDPRLIAETPFADFAALNVGGQPILRFEDVLELARGRVRVLIDVKETDIATAGAVIQCVAHVAPAPSVTFGFRATEQIALLQRRSAHSHSLSFITDYADAPKVISAGANAVRIWEDDFEQTNARAQIPVGVPIWITAGRRRASEIPGHTTRERLSRLIDAGIDAVLLNDPTLIRNCRRNRDI